MSVREPFSGRVVFVSVETGLGVSLSVACVGGEGDRSVSS